MRPGCMPLSKFDLCFIPEHDNFPSRDNVVTTIGALVAPLEFDKQRVSELKAKFNLTEDNYLGILIGGLSLDNNLSLDNFKDFFNCIINFSRRNKYKILITTSRRTPKEVEQLVESLFSNNKLASLVVIANKYNPPLAIEAILCLSATFLVTSDSISMITEAISTGNPTVVVEMDEKSSISAKKDRFLNSLIKRGLIKMTSIEELISILEETKLSVSKNSVFSNQREKIIKRLERIF
jgi:hypothetical protein